MPDIFMLREQIRVLGHTLGRAYRDICDVLSGLTSREMAERVLSMVPRGYWAITHAWHTAAIKPAGLVADFASYLSYAVYYSRPDEFAHMIVRLLGEWVFENYASRELTFSSSPLLTRREAVRRIGDIVQRYGDAQRYYDMLVEPLYRRCLNTYRYQGDKEEMICSFASFILGDPTAAWYVLLAADAVPRRALKEAQKSIAKEYRKYVGWSDMVTLYVFMKTPAFHIIRALANYLWLKIENESYGNCYVAEL